MECSAVSLADLDIKLKDLARSLLRRFTMLSSAKGSESVEEKEWAKTILYQRKLKGRIDKV